MGWLSSWNSVESAVLRKFAATCLLSPCAMNKRLLFVVYGAHGHVLLTFDCNCWPHSASSSVHTVMWLAIGHDTHLSAKLRWFITSEDFPCTFCTAVHLHPCVSDTGLSAYNYFLQYCLDLLHSAFRTKQTYWPEKRLWCDLFWNECNVKP